MNISSVRRVRIEQPDPTSDLLAVWPKPISNEINTQEGNHAYDHA